MATTEAESSSQLPCYERYYEKRMQFLKDLKDKTQNGKAAEQQEGQHGEQLATLHREMISLMEQDVDLMRQLLNLKVTIDNLRQHQSQPDLLSTCSSVTSLSEASTPRMATMHSSYEVSTSNNNYAPINNYAPANNYTPTPYSEPAPSRVLLIPVTPSTQPRSLTQESNHSSVSSGVWSNDSTQTRVRL